ncbi:LA_3751/LA_3752 family putative glycosyltransferase [Nostoc sp. UHCC 0870]|uniref:LA_3751/LA_3752 family putative glycosyltransferase n=1 Tax=Nostoc sp. UHCC 0870 TaxID=2914041 RepID=UPI001EDD67D4|nr:hypothetical protein [Nostoc sp. UHCC 0870]UKO97471.1 hypothetical protein L6494_23310 [Nostoc sp. UHCC 0870]
MQLPRINLPLLVILLGVCFSLYLLSLVSDEVYFSGDGGLKALLAKQFSSGNLRFDLDLQVPSWIHSLWDNGLYPFEPPFSYKIDNRYYITFPFTFPLLTAPFYRVLGFKGFYVVPLVSTWIIWLIFYRLCQFFKLGIFMTSLALATLIFSSPLTMYSAMYWEHTLAVCLAFSGLAIIFSKGEHKFSRQDAVFSGILIGLSVWFRPEFLALAVILFVFVVISYKINLGELSLIKNNRIIFILAISITILCFFLTNKVIYNHHLGIHALQVVEEFSPRTRLAKSENIFSSMWGKFFYCFPLGYFVFVFIGFSVFSDSIKLTATMRKLLLISSLFICLAPLLLPSDGGKQWGARFLLILIPLLTLLTVLAFQATLNIKKLGFKYISSTIFVALFVIGFHINTYLGTNYSYTGNNTETIKILNFLQKDSNRMIAVAHQYVSQTFESTFNEKSFFLTKTTNDIRKLSLALDEQGYQKFIYICPAYDSCFSSPKIPDVLEVSTNQSPLRIQFAEIKKYQKYIVREATIIKQRNRTITK